MSNALKNTSMKPSVVKQESYEPHEVDRIQSKLDKKLGPEYVSTRPGAGGVRVSYIEGWKALNLANQVFGFNGWFSEVKMIQVDYLDTLPGGRYNVGLSIVVRVTLKDGSFHEDIGYGSCENAKSKAMAFEKAKKEAMTDGMKRALRCFGNAMGNCLYDKEYLSKISGVKCAPPDFDESNLMRVTNNVTASRSNTHPHHSLLQDESGNSRASNRISQNQQASRIQDLKRRSASGNHEVKRSYKRQNNDTDDMFDDSLTFSDDINLESEDFNDEVNELLNSKNKTSAEEVPHEDRKESPNFESNSGAPQSEEELNSPSKITETEIRLSQVGFYKARVAEEVQKNSPLSSAHSFNPNFVSPSIRRTLDPTKSAPVKRSMVPEPKAIRYDNPKLIPNRQVGKPKYPPPKKSKIASPPLDNIPQPASN